MNVDDEGNAMFAFQDLDYIPCGYNSITAPYIPTLAGTMRAAAKLMKLRPSQEKMNELDTIPMETRQVVCDLGCGDGEFLIGLLDHINISKSRTYSATGIGIDYDASLLDAARESSPQTWLLYDFNTDAEDLADQLINIHHITHAFIYLVPKQLALPTVRSIITRLCQADVVVCCYKYHPTYLTIVEQDSKMDLIILSN